MMSDGERNTLVPTVHAKGVAARLDALLELTRFVARPGALSVGLDEIPRRLAGLFPCDVCSIYLLEGEELVMRGNVGFPTDALGEVRLAVGQGITGMAVEMMRPISLDAAQRHDRNQTFPMLHEERFPIFMAVPIAGPHGPLGALVLRRREPPAFDQGEVELATALTAPIAALVERARLSAALRSVRDRGGVRRGDSFSLERARAIDDLCEALALLTGELPEIPRSAVMGGEEIGFYDLLISERFQPAAVVLAAPATPTASALLALLGVPAVGDVAGLFRWAADGDVLIVDGDHALVRVNPRRSELARLRDEQRDLSR